MLRELVEKKHVLFGEKASDWQEAIRLACSPLIRDGTVDERYPEEIIRCVKEYGPYIVLLPGVAMPHSQENSPLVHDTGVSFMRLEEPVSFDENDPEKWADLFFAIAANNPERHLQNIMNLMTIFQDEALLQRLRESSCCQDLLELADEFGI